MNKLIPLLLIGLILTKCTRTESIEDVSFQNQIIVNSEQTKDSVQIDDLIQNVQIIAMNETMGNYIAYADKILMHNNKYIVFDKIMAKRVSVFDNEANFITQLGIKGFGPNEITQINDVWINADNEVEVYDFALRKIVTYAQDYSVKKSRILNGSSIYQSIASIPSSKNYVGFAGYSIPNQPYKNSNHLLAVLNYEFQPIQTYLHYTSELNGALISTPTSPFHRIGDTITFYYNFSSVIFNILPDNSIVRRYEIKYEPKPFPNDFEETIFLKNIALYSQNNIDFNKIRSLYKGFTGFRGKWLETNNYSLFDSFDPDQRSFLTLYSKTSKNIFAQSRIFYSKDFKVLPNLIAADAESNSFIAIHSGVSLLSILKEDSAFFLTVKNNLDHNYIIRVKLKNL